MRLVSLGVFVLSLLLAPLPASAGEVIPKEKKTKPKKVAPPPPPKPREPSTPTVAETVALINEKLKNARPRNAFGEYDQLTLSEDGQLTKQTWHQIAYDHAQPGDPTLWISSTTHIRSIEEVRGSTFFSSKHCIDFAGADFAGAFVMGICFAPNPETSEALEKAAQHLFRLKMQDLNESK